MWPHCASGRPRRLYRLRRLCQGDYSRAARHQVLADAINWVLYPDDSTEEGRMLRLKQEAFLVSASLQDLVARHLREFGELQSLGRANAIHLNDTTPRWRRRS